MSAQGMSLLRDHGVVGGVEHDRLLAGNQLDLADDHLDRGLTRIFMFFEILALNQRNQGLLQFALAAAVQVVRGSTAGRFAGLIQHGLGNGGQRVFFHTLFCSTPPLGVTVITGQPPRKVTP